MLGNEGRKERHKESDISIEIQKTAGLKRLRRQVVRPLVMTAFRPHSRLKRTPKYTFFSFLSASCSAEAPP